MVDDVEPDLAATFSSVARELRAEAPSVQATLERMVRLAVETIEGCDYAGISYVERRRITTPAASDDTPRKVDAIQYEVDEGPCLDAIREYEMFQTDDLSQETRWPKFSARVVQETGVVSMLSLPKICHGPSRIARRREFTLTGRRRSTRAGAAHQ